MRKTPSVTQFSGFLGGLENSDRNAHDTGRDTEKCGFTLHHRASKILHNSRDGMPVWIPLSNGGYALVIESTHLRNEAGRHPFVIQILYSEDGRGWTEPADIYIPRTDNSKAGAPWIAELPDGRLAVSFQTDEDKAVKGDRTSVMKIMLSDGKPAKDLRLDSFSPAETVFNVPEEAGALLAAVYTDGAELFVSAGSPDGAVMKRFRET